MSTQIKLLDEMLEAKRWSAKKDIYYQVFQSIECIREVKEPELSIIIISWRLHEDTLTNFKVLMEQRKTRNFELIFVDNGAQASEFEVLKPYSDVYIKLKVNTGAYLARNVGAIFAKAPLLLFLEDDGIPDQEIVASHLMVHKKYEVHAVMGSYLHKTENVLNEKESHYYSGDKFYPKFSQLEGNTSYLAEVFFTVGGWDDEINFGGGGKDLAIRLLEYSKDYSKQIYSPISIIYHDYASTEEHLKNKLEKQQKSFLRLQQKNAEWLSFDKKWAPFLGKEELLTKSQLWASNINDFHREFNSIEARIKERNALSIEKYMRGKVYLDDKVTFLRETSQHPDMKYIIFGAGEFGRKAMQKLQSYGIAISGFVDNNPNLWGELLEGLPVISPEEITSDMFVFVASTWHLEIKEQLLDMGLRKDEHFKIIFN